MNFKINPKIDSAKLLKRLINRANKWVDEILNPSIDSPYHDLTPLDNLSKDEYMNALEWALSQKKIKNIAITGSYGSGKSSILRSFERLNPQHKYLPISLASFTPDPKGNTPPNELGESKEQKKPYEDFKTGQLIEQSILQQIFYREKAKRFRHSRFKRIIRPERIDVLKWSIPLSLWLLVGFGLFFGQLFDSVSPLPISPEARPWLFSIFLLGAIFWIYLVVDFLRGLSLDKVNVLKGDIELSKKVDSSIFNKYLDEIIYFFSNEKYNVVYIEDLDRFGDSSLFVKLRELNLLLNEAKEIKKKPIVFIYAVRDELFESTDARTKFFDFIIPIIPIINPSNSKDILLERLKDFKLLKPLVGYVSSFVRDMRILHNIINEFTVYSKKLNDFETDYNKLFSIIVYKNLHPADFSNLHFNKGIVYDFFKSKDEMVKVITSEIEAEIVAKTQELNEIDSELMESIRDLNLMYLGAFSTLLSNQNSSNIMLDGNRIGLEGLSNHDIMEVLLSNKNVRYISKRNSWADLKIEDLEQVIPSEKDYKHRKELVLGKRGSLKYDLELKVENLKIKKREVALYNLKELLNDNHSRSFLKEKLQSNRFIYHLLAEGYIDENYHNYISYFYPGSLTRNDEEFRRIVYEGSSKEFNFKLTNFPEILESFTLRHFEYSSILNFHLLNYLLEHSRRFDLELKTIIQNLSSQDALSKDFIFQYFHEDFTQKGRFIKSLCTHWPEFWKFIVDEPIPYERQFTFLTLILMNCDEVNLESINDKTGYLLTSSIEDMPHFIEEYEEHEHVEKIKSVVKKLDVQFKDLNSPAKESHLLEFIYNNSLYELNPHMIQLIIERVGNTKFVENQIYTSVQESDLETLSEKVEDDLYEFVKNCILGQSSMEEKEIHFLSLLNSELKPDIKEELIQIQKHPIKDISEVQTDLWSTLLLKLKVKPSWDNIGHYYSLSEEGKLSQELVDFINNQDVANELSKLDFKFDSLDSLASRNLEKELLLSESMETYSYGKIIPTTITSSDDLLFTDLQKEKVCILLENHVLAFSISHYDQLQSSYSPLHMRLIAQNQQSFTRSFEELHFTVSDLRPLLMQEDISLETKIYVVKKTDFSILSINKGLADILFPFLVEQDIRFDKTIELHLFEFAGSLGNQLSYFNMILDSLTKSEITDLLLQLPIQYAKMAMKGKKTHLPSQKLIFEILRKLLRKGYVSSTQEVDEKIKVNSKKGDWLR